MPDVVAMYEDAKRLALAFLAQTQPIPCATMDYLSRELAEAWVVAWNSLECVESGGKRGVVRAPALLVGKLGGEVRSSEPGPFNRPLEINPSTPDGARRLLDAWIDHTWFGQGLVVVGEVVEWPGFFQFQVNSRRFAVTRELGDMLVGMGPVCVIKRSGDVRVLGSAQPDQALRALAKETRR